MNFEEQQEFIKSLGFTKHKTNGYWITSKYLVTIAFINNAIIITKIKNL